MFQVWADLFENNLTFFSLVRDNIYILFIIVQHQYNGMNGERKVTLGQWFENFLCCSFMPLFFFFFFISSSFPFIIITFWSDLFLDYIAKLKDGKKAWLLTITNQLGNYHIYIYMYIYIYIKQTSFS